MSSSPLPSELSFATETFVGPQGHRVVLQEMIHVAPQAFFQKRLASWRQASEEGALLLLEGMRLPSSWKNPLALYETMASFMGFAVQPTPPRNPELFQDLTWAIGDIEWGRLTRGEKAQFFLFCKALQAAHLVTKTSHALLAKRGPEAQEAARREALDAFFTVDASPQGMEEAVGRHVKASFVDGLLLRRRNEALWEKVQAAAPQTVILPWGQAHMEGLRALLQEGGYERQEGSLLKIFRNGDTSVKVEGPFLQMDPRRTRPS